MNTGGLRLLAASSICSRCFCRKSWDSSRYNSCDDCRLQQRLRMNENYQNNLNLPAATPSSSTTEFVIAATIAGSENNFRALEESQASNAKRRRLNTNDSHRGKIFLGSFLSRLSSHSTDDINIIRFYFGSS